jgi:hypothetical protein
MYPYERRVYHHWIVVTILISFYFQYLICICYRLTSLKIAQRRPVLAKNW